MFGDDRFEVSVLVAAVVVCVALVLAILFVPDLAEWLSTWLR
jgi:hypothetical protein